MSRLPFALLRSYACTLTPMLHATSALHRRATLYAGRAQANQRPPRHVAQYAVAPDTGFFARGTTFQELGLSPVLVDALERAGFTEPAHIQVPLPTADYGSRITTTCVLFNACGWAVLSVRPPSMPVQSVAIPEFNQGVDVAIAAETGSGKTLSYLLPIIESLMRRREDMQNNRPDAPEYASHATPPFPTAPHPPHAPHCHNTRTNTISRLS